MDSAALEDVSEFMLDNRVAFKWKKHDVIIIDNRVTMHRERRSRGRGASSRRWAGHQRTGSWAAEVPHRWRAA